MIQTSRNDIFESLSAIMKTAPKFDPQTKQEIESFFSYCKEGMDTDSQKLLATLFIKALNKKINSEFISEYIYLGKYETSQIQLFNILIEKFPFVKYSVVKKRLLSKNGLTDDQRTNSIRQNNVSFGLHRNGVAVPLW